jgi:uncharacterized protein YecE (DUF72 family)
VFDTVEVNATFHAVPSDSTVRGWYSRTPPGFRFALKFPREISHDLRLALPEAEAPTRDFLRVADLLQDKCGPLLLQLPPSFDRSPANRRTLARFLDLLPTHRHPLAVELRHASWIDPAVERALAEHNVAWCLVDGDTPNHRAIMFTADFAYVRWNRSGLRFDGFAEIQHDRSEALDWWADTLRQAPVHTVYGYMANEFAGHAPASLNMLAARLNLPQVDPKAHWPQRVLF